MTRVEISGQTIGPIQDTEGNALQATCTVKNLVGTNATHWSAETGGTSSTSSLVSDAYGTPKLAGATRYIEVGQYLLDVPAISVVDRRVEVVSGLDSGVLAVVKEAPLNPKHSEYGALFDGTTDDTVALNLARAAIPASGGTMLIPPGESIVDPAPADKFLLKSNMTLIGTGAGSVLKMKPSVAVDTSVYSIIQQQDADLIENVTIRDVTFDGNRSGGNHGTGESIFGIHLSHAQGLLIDGCRFRNFRSEGIYLAATATPVNQPRDITITNNFITDCGIKEGGDGGNLRMGIALICGSGVEISGNHLSDIGSMGIDLEANTVDQVLDHVTIQGNHLKDCEHGFINVDPFSVATGHAISVLGNTGVGAPVKGIIVLGTGITVEGNTMLEVLDIGVQIAFGSIGVGVSGNVIKTTRNTETTRNKVLIDNATFCRVADNILLGTAGTAGVVESGGASNDNKLGPNIIEHATPYSTVGTRTETDTTWRASRTIAPASGGALFTLTGTSGQITNTTGALTVQAAGQMVFNANGAVEVARFNSSGHYLTGSGKKVLATGGVGVGNSAAATEVIGKAVVKKIEVFDAAGASIGFVPVYTSIT